ncbi:hypothetical protein [Dietzia sp. 179-F 9C3 NHS]|uniref:hypothetical protein n=1 Tax=Dietzia sp. 179-F 9C3 NHS TaxID=3374295 RepID=UPI003879A224
MSAPFDFSPEQLVTNLGIFVVVPMAVAAGVVATVRKREVDAPRGGLGMWATGFLALVLGFLSCAVWLSWTAADHDGQVRGPGLPAPTSFPTWQVVACGITTVGACFLAAHWSRTVVAGGLAAAAGTAGGFTAAFSVDLAVPEISQGGVGLFLSIVGWGAGLTILMAVRAIVLTAAGSSGASSFDPAGDPTRIL